MSQRVLVTGALGFTGRYLVPKLRGSGHEVFGIGPQSDNSKENYTSCDLRDSDTLCSILLKFKPTVVIHLAAISFVAHGDVNEIYDVNILGTRSLFSCLQKCEIKLDAILVASSANVYGNSAAGVLSESEPCMPENDYGLTKLAIEHLSRIWQKHLPIVIVRPVNYTGVGQSKRFLIPKLLHHFKDKASSIELGNIDISRDFSDVRFVVSAYEQLMLSRPIGTTVNICSGGAVSIREIIIMLEKISGHSMELRINPDFVRDNDVARLEGDDTLLKKYALNQ